MVQTKKLILEANEKPTTGKWILLSFQHVFAMFGATILVPLLTGLPISVALFTSGVGTLIYILCTKAKVPVYLGSSFAYIVPISVISGFSTNPGTAYYGSVLTGLLVVGIIYVIIALMIRKIGKGWIDKLLPPIIIGPMITIIGFGLAYIAVGSSGLGQDGGSWKVILTAIVSLTIVVVVALKAKGFFKIIPFLSGIVGGYIVASLFGLVDFSNFLAVADSTREWVKIPEFMILGFKDSQVEFLGSNISFYQLNFAAVITIAPIAFVTACEHIGDHSVLSKITGKNYLKDPGLDKTLLGDGLATSFAAIMGGPANTTYGENTAVVGITRVGSVWVTGLAAVFAIILSFFNIFTTLVASIPAPVMGGISVILYGFIGLNGIKVLVDNKVDFGKTRNMIIASVMLVLGIGGAMIDIGQLVNQFLFDIFKINANLPSLMFAGMALAAVMGILLNLVLPKDEENLNEEDIKAL